MRSLVFLFVAVWGAAAQTPAFEAATIKPNHSLNAVSSIRLARGHVSMENVSLQKIILNAYNIPDDRAYMVDGPGWLSTTQFDIEATFPGDTAQDQLRQMLQTMLVERFRMAAHREMRQLSIYSLAIAKNGPKIHAGEGGPGRTSGAPGRLEATKITMSKLADLLSSQLRIPVVDSTGLAGVFDFTLEWTPDDPAPADNGGASIFTALQDQLGLRLTSGKGPVEVLVVDRIDKSPTEN